MQTRRKTALNLDTLCDKRYKTKHDKWYCKKTAKTTLNLKM